MASAAMQVGVAQAAPSPRLKLVLDNLCHRCGCVGRHTQQSDCIDALRRNVDAQRGINGTLSLRLERATSTVNGHVWRELDNLRREAIEYRGLAKSLLSRLGKYEDVSGVKLPERTTVSIRSHMAINARKAAEAAKGQIGLFGESEDQAEQVGTDVGWADRSSQESGVAEQGDEL